MLLSGGEGDVGPWHFLSLIGVQGAVCHFSLPSRSKKRWLCDLLIWHSNHFKQDTNILSDQHIVGLGPVMGFINNKTDKKITLICTFNMLLLLLLVYIICNFTIKLLIECGGLEIGLQLIIS